MAQTHRQSRWHCFVGGKSGGHIIPCLTLALDIKHKDSAARILFFTSDRSLDQSLIKDNSIVDEHHIIKLSHPKIRSALVCAWQIIKAWSKALRMFITRKPEKVITTGGVEAIPICIAAWMYAIPIELYELNATPGKASRVIAWFASKVHCSFKSCMPYFPLKKGIHTSYPIRFNAEHRITKKDACKILSLDEHTKIILVMGGSQGSQELNQLIKNHLDLFKECTIIHQVGSEQVSNWQHFYNEHKIQSYVFSFDERMHLFYSAADLVLSRAGAGALFELLYFKKRTLLFPLKTSTTNHQYDNAYAMQAEHPELFSVCGDVNEFASSFFTIVKAFTGM